MVAAGCSEEATGGDETGDTGGEAPTEPVEMHPSLHKTHSGLELEGTGYQRLAVGNITRPIGDPTCCQDIVLGGPLSPDAELFFGGGSTERGLTFLADRPTQAYAMAATGDGIQDLALADLNSDGRNDLLAVSTNGQLGVRLGVSSDSPLDALNLFGIANGPLGRIALGDLDCDGDLDVVATAPDDAGIVVALQTSSGAFGAGSFISTVPVNDEDAAGNPQDVAVGDLDGAGALDLVTMNDNGTVTTFLRATCDGPVTVTSKRVYSNVGNCSMHNETGCISDTNGSHVITQDVFCETALSDVTVAFADRVLVFCNTGDINAIISTSGYADYRWDVNGPGHAHLARISDINWWSTPKSLHALVERQLLRLTDPGTDYNGSDRPKLEVLKAEGIPVQFDMVRHTNDGIADWWQRIIWVSSIGELGFVR